MKIGIICATDVEIEPFLSHIEGISQTHKAMRTVYEGNICGIKAAVLCSGVCKVNAAIAAQVLADTYNVDVIINCGTAGGMDPKLNIFDTVVATEVCYHDVDEDILPEFHSRKKICYFYSDRELLDLLNKALKKTNYGVFWGRMVTGEAFISDSGRNQINQKYKPLSVDMETAAIAHVCYVNHIPFIAIRTITDTAEHSGNANFEINCKKASAIAKDITLALLKEVGNYDK